MTPDRWMRAVERAQAVPGSYGRKLLDRDDIARLLRRQFASLRRVVRQQQALYGSKVMFATGYRCACADILVALDAWRRGGR